MAMSFYLWGERAKMMSFRQRTAGILILCVSLGNIITAVGLLTLLIVTLTNQPLVASSDPGYTQKLVILLSVLITVDWLDTYVVSISTGYRIAMRDSYGNLWIAPCMPLLFSSFQIYTDQAFGCQTTPWVLSERSCCRTG